MNNSTNSEPLVKRKNSTASGEKSNFPEGALNILSAAEELFSEHGFSSVSMNSIAQRAGVSKANVFHHFETKEALYLAVFQNASAEMSKLITELDSSDGSASEQIDRYTREHLKNLFDKARFTQLILRELQQEGESESIRLAQDSMNNNFSKMVNIIKNFQIRGELRQDVEPAMIATILIGCNLFYFQVHSILDKFPDLQFAKSAHSYCDELIDILLNGIVHKA